MTVSQAICTQLQYPVHQTKCPPICNLGNLMFAKYTTHMVLQTLNCCMNTQVESVIHKSRTHKIATYALIKELCNVS